MPYYIAIFYIYFLQCVLVTTSYHKEALHARYVHKIPCLWLILGILMIASVLLAMVVFKTTALVCSVLYYIY